MNDTMILLTSIVDTIEAALFIHYLDPARTERPSGLADLSTVSRGRERANVQLQAWEGAECLTESSCSGGERPDEREKHPFIPNANSAFNYASTFPETCQIGLLYARMGPMKTIK
ncbi:hypothetical protein ACLB1Q_34955 [Escherichia coli]